MVELGSFYASPGFYDEEIHLYLAYDLHQGEAHPDEDEFVACEKMPLAELLEMIGQGKVKDGKTVIGVLLVKEKGIQ